MSQINVLIAVERPTAQKLRDNFKLVDREDPSLGYVRNDLTDAQRAKLRDFIDGHWKGPTIAGTTYEILSLYIPRRMISFDDPRLWWLEKFKQLLPGKEFVIGAWDVFGAQYGTKIVPGDWDLTDPENPVQLPETIRGTPVYPVPQYVMNNPDKVFPDDVQYSVDGAEVSRTPATGPREVANYLGWRARRWS